MKECEIKNLYNLNETIAKDIFEGCIYPWEVLPKIKDFSLVLGLDKNSKPSMPLSPNLSSFLAISIVSESPKEIRLLILDW